MKQIRTWIHLIITALIIGLVGSVDVPTAEASPSQQTCRKKRRKAKRRRAKRRKAKRRKAKRRSKRKRARRRARTKKMTYRTVLRWWNDGHGTREILARAQERSYRPSKRDLRRLKKKHVAPELLSALTDLRKGKVTLATRPARLIDLDGEMSDEDVDFDSLPPPVGMPQWAANKARKRAKAKKKTLDRSLRPSAPFEDSGRSAQDDRGASRRPVVAASK